MANALLRNHLYQYIVFNLVAINLFRHLTYIDNMFNNIWYGLIIYGVIDVNGREFKVTSKVYFEIMHNNEAMGRIEIGLFGELAPKTVKNFETICTNGIKKLSYEGTRFHRVINKFIVQGGDIINGDGTGSISIYGKYFDDENLEINHTVSGFIGMANRGPNTNGCQFYITTMPTPWLDGKHTIFGKVTTGQAVVHKIEKVKTDTDDYPEKNVIIHECGFINDLSPNFISDQPYDLWAWLKASAVPLGMSFIILSIFHYMIRQLDQYS